MITSFQELEVWKKAHALTLKIYEVTAHFPPDGGARGLARSSFDFLRYLEMASGSLEETRYFLILSRDLKHLAAEQFAKLNDDCDEVGRLLGGLARSLRKRLA